MEEKRIIRLLIDKTPKQLKFKFALWTKEAVKQLIKQELKKSCLSLLLILDMNIEYWNWEIGNWIEGSVATLKSHKKHNNSTNLILYSLPSIHLLAFIKQIGYNKQLSHHCNLCNCRMFTFFFESFIIGFNLFIVLYGIEGSELELNWGVRIENWGVRWQ